MKYRLTKEAIEELKAMEFSTPRSMFVMEGMGDMRRILSGEWIFEEIKPKIPKRAKLPKPVLKSIDDFKALEGWEHKWEHNAPSIWFNPKTNRCNSLEGLYTAKIRQIGIPENEYLVKDCIEQETKEPISIADYQAHKDREFEAKVREIIKKVLKEEAGE